MKKLIILLVALATISSQAWGAIYYVDPDCTDTNPASATVDGTAYDPATPACTGGSDSYYVTIADVNLKSFSVGDSILFKKGETWREQLTPPSSGSAGSPITFGAYGTGNAPIISGSNLVSGWTVYSGNVYQATLTTKPWVVTFDRTMGIKETALGNVNAAYEWFWTGNVLYIYSASGDPDTVYTSPGMEAGQRNWGIFINNVDYITVSNLHVYGTNDSAICSQYEDHLSVDGVTVKFVGPTYYGSAAVDFHEGSTNASITNSTIQYTQTDGVWSKSANFVATGNNISHIDGPGADGIQTFNANSITITNNTIDMSDSVTSAKFCITAAGGTGSHIISGNTLTGCPESGIFTVTVSDIVISRNLIRNVQGSGYGISIGNEAATNNTTIQYNVIYGCYVGIMKNSTYEAKNLNIYNNTIYGIATTGRGISLGLSPISGKVKNNIVYSGGTCDGCGVNLGGSSIIGGETFEMDYNIFYPERTNFIRAMNWSTYSTLAAWASATGYDTHSNKDDPQFVSTVTPDFSLQSSSPAINAGSSVGLTTDYAGRAVPVGAAPDIGAYEYGGLSRIKNFLNLRNFPEMKGWR